MIEEKMTSYINKPIEFATKKKSAFIWLGVAIITLIIAIGLLAYGLFLCFRNPTVWILEHGDRKQARMVKNTEKIIEKQRNKEKAAEYKQFKKDNSRKALRAKKKEELSTPVVPVPFYKNEEYNIDINQEKQL